SSRAAERVDALRGVQAQEILRARPLPDAPLAREMLDRLLQGAPQVVLKLRPVVLKLLQGLGRGRIENVILTRAQGVGANQLGTVGGSRQCRRYEVVLVERVNRPQIGDRLRSAVLRAPRDRGPA